MRYKVKVKQKKTPQNNCTQLKTWIIQSFFKYTKEYYHIPNSSTSPYLYGYMKLNSKLKRLKLRKI